MNKQFYIFLSAFLYFIGIQVGAQDHCSSVRGYELIKSSVSPGFSHYECLYDVNFYHLDLAFTDTLNYIEGSTSIHVNMLADADSLVFELSGSLIVDSVSVNSLSAGFSQEDDLLFITSSSGFASGSRIKATIYYYGKPGQSFFFSGISNRRDFTYDKNVTYTLSEPFQAKDWFPCKQDLNDKADSAWIFITTDSSLMAGSNGVLSNITVLPEGRKRYEWKTSYPIAFYLISVAVSDYRDYSYYIGFPDGDSLLFQNFVYDHPELMTNEQQAIDKTADMLLLFSELFGPYPFMNEKYGHCLAPMGGGMEHQTMTTLQNFNFELVAHELAHQWFGDNVTCGTWQDIWVNEGFASYGEYLALEYLAGKKAAINWMSSAHNYAKRSPGESIYLSEDEANNTSRIFSLPLSYKKGAAILHSLRYEMNNDNLFFQVFKEFQIRFTDSSAIAIDFLNVLNELSGKNYSWFFDQWYYGKGYPVFQTVWKQNSDSLVIESYQNNISDSPAIFKSHYDYYISFENGSDTLVKVLYDESYERFGFKFPERVISVTGDPSVNVLSENTILRYFPQDTLFEISPNPFSEYIDVVFNTNRPQRLVLITDLNGKVLYQQEVKNGSARITPGALREGIYIFVVEEKGRTYSTRVIKM